MKAGSPALVYDSLDLRDRSSQLGLTLALQGDAAAQTTSGSMTILEAIEVITVPCAAKAATVARKVLQNLGYIPGGLISRLDLGVGRECRGA